MPLKKGLEKKRKWAQLMGSKNARKNCVDDHIAVPTPVQPNHPNEVNENEKEEDNELTNDASKRRAPLTRELLGLTNATRTRAPYARQDSGNRIIHWDSLKSLISCNTVCKVCGSDVNIGETTIGIATQVVMTCKNKKCNIVKNNFVRRTNWKEHKFRIDSSESYALNCQFVLGLMQTGCGAQEAAVNLTFLDLPHASTFQKTTFQRVQSAIRPIIKNVSEKSMMEAREKEVSATIGHDKIEDWKQKKIHPDDVRLTISYDMGWNKRSSGNKYDSMSGHGFVLGGNTKKILQHRVL